MTEKQIHQEFERWLKARGIIFITCRMDRASTIAKGMPDYVVFNKGKCVFIEVKTETGKLSLDQENQIIRIKANGTPCAVARSVEECCQVVRHYLYEKPPYAAMVEDEKPIAGESPMRGLGIITSGGCDLVVKWGGTGYQIVRAATQYDLLHIARI